MAQYNFRLFLKPTAIGKAIIDRVSAEGADRQADARRWIELGYALEQAGFRLDGTTVYQGGRPIGADGPAVIPVPAHSLQSAIAVPASQGSSVAGGREVAQATLAAPASAAPTGPVHATAASTAQAAVTPSSRPDPAPAAAPGAAVQVGRSAPAADDVTDCFRALSA